MALTTELAIFETSEAFRNNPEIMAPAFSMVLKERGVYAPGYYGTQVEDPSIGYMLLNWDKYESHQALIEGPSAPEIHTAFKLTLDGNVEVYHVKFSGPTIALHQPVTEVFILSLKAPENRQAVLDILSKVSEDTDTSLVFGTLREDENRIAVITGWPTVEAHWEHAKKPEVAATVDKLLSLANSDHLFHAKLSQFYGS